MVTCLNMFPYKNVIASNLSPEVIILGFSNPDYNELKITFGSYSLVYIGDTNSTKKRRVLLIALRPENE